MQKLFFTALLSLCLSGAPASEAQDLTACIVAQKVKDRGELSRATSLYTTCIQEGELMAGSRSIALNNRGNIYLGEGQYNQAIADFDESIKLNPEYSNAYNNRGMAKQLKGLYNAAIDDYAQALKIDESHLNAANNLAWIKATCPISSLRDGQLAITLASRVNKATDYQDSSSLDTLAAAYAEAGQFQAAIDHQQKAITLAAENEKKQQKDRLSNYRQGKAYRDLSGL